MMKGLRQRMIKDARRLMLSGGVNTAPVTVHWVTQDGGTSHDPYEQSVSTLTTAVGSAALSPPPFVFFLTPADVDRRGFVLIRVGDVILDILAGVLEAALPAGARDIRFEINGKFYVQKEAAEELQDWTDALIDGAPVFRTIALEPSRK